MTPRALHVPQFTTAHAAQPFWYRATNQVGRFFPKAFKPDADQFLERVQKKHRHLSLGNPRPETLLAMQQLVDALNEEASLSFVGRIAASMDCERMLEQHLFVEKTLADNPDITKTSLPPPVFIMGWMRSGTTFTQRLLEVDPANRGLPYWEGMFPTPLSGSQKERVANVDHVLRQLEHLSPEYNAIHPMTATQGEECVALFSNVFRTLQYDVQYRVPSFVRWLRQQDAGIAYRQYKQQLQIAQHYRPCGERFLLKDPTHPIFMKTILDVFPDARFIFTHRDPAVVFSSMASLHAYTRALFSDDIDPKQIGPYLFNGYVVDTMEEAVRVADTLPAGRVAHIRQKDMHRDPIGTAASAYKALGLELTDSARAAMQALLDKKSRQAKDTHAHSCEEFGLNPDACRERLHAYCQRFDV